MTTFFTGFGSPSRTLFAILPRLSRSLVNRAASRPIPQTQGIDLLRPDVAHRLTPSLPGTETISTPHEFLRAIGRSSETKLTIEKWEDFWKTSGQDLKKLGLAVRDRRYILWCMEKYRSGMPPQVFAHELRPKKTIRGWGPKVQNGKRIRSRRFKNT